MTALKRLRETALAARKNAYCPHTGYSVGAAVQGVSGKVFGGCNVESPTAISVICAERSAIHNAITHGERRIKAVFTVSESSVPCGACRQMIREFADGDIPIFSLRIKPQPGRESLLRTTISRLLPQAHTEKFLMGADRHGND